jgi:holo-[acyl-carrier protein] synthase
MKIFGIGTDIVNIKRIDQSLKKNGESFKKRIFSKNEIIYCENKKTPARFYAKRFAAKEAMSKALGTGIRKGIDFKNIEVNNDTLGKPFIKLKGTTAKFLKKKIKTKNYLIYLSLSDDEPWAQATVIISYS